MAFIDEKIYLWVRLSGTGPREFAPTGKVPQQKINGVIQTHGICLITQSLRGYLLAHQFFVCKSGMPGIFSRLYTHSGITR